MLAVDKSSRRQYNQQNWFERYFARAVLKGKGKKYDSDHRLSRNFKILQVMNGFQF